jgi:YVTN family beta-propeller protein
MDYRILGPLEVRNSGRSVALGGDKQRALLAILVLHANEVVSADRLIDELWGESPPASALRTLQAYVSRLRKALDANGAASAAPDANPAAGSSNGAVVTRGRGYLLAVAPGELDLDRFGKLVEQGRDALAAGRPEEAARVLREALELWRGPALADFTYEPFAQAAIAQLEELQLGALEERIDADLGAGRDHELVGELRDLVKRHPLRERLRGQLMLALHRSGRQAEALEVYQEFRRALSEQLGLDPGPGLQQLELAILNRDPSLEARSANGAPTDLTAPSPLPTRRSVDRRRRRLAVGGLTLAALVLAGMVVAASLGGTSPSAALAADSVGAINPSGGAIGADVPVGSSPTSVAAGPDALWVANYNDGTVSRIDPATHTVVQTITVGSGPSGIAVGPGAVWVANSVSGTVSRIDPTVNTVVETIPVGNGPSGVAVGDGWVWVTNASDGTLSRINALTGAPSKPIALGGDPTGVAAADRAVWVSDTADRRVLRVDPHTNQVEPIIVGTGPTAITVGFDSVWVANSLDGNVSRINPHTNEVAATIPAGNTPNAIAVGLGGVWIADEFGQTVKEINPATGTVARTTAVGNSPRGLTIAGGLVWVAAQNSGASHRGGTLTVLQNQPFGSSDPVNDAGTLASLLTLYMTNDGLTAFKRVGGSDGAQVVPDLANTIPTPTDGGRTYTFRLRPGIRYSNGQPVRAEDFRHAIERSFVVGRSTWSTYYEDIVGGAACVAHPKRCDLSRGIVTDDATGTVEFHLVAADPEFPDKLAVYIAFAVPRGTPNHDIGTHPLPATGPYEITSDTRRQVTLVRNPYFHEWSHAAQADGYPDRIVWRIGASTEAAVTAVEHAHADYTLDPPPTDRLHELRTRFARQLHRIPIDVTLLMGLNTRAAPFNDLRVRRAVNYAVDRSKVAELLGQDSRPACQTLPPYVPGHRAYCPYTLDPSAGVWSRPDLPKAQALIAASGTRGTPVTIWIPPTSAFGDFTPAGRYLASLLDRLGYPTQIKTFDAKHAASFARVADSRTKAQAFLGPLAANYPAASGFLGPQSQSCNSFEPNSTSNPNWSEFCDRQFDATVRNALAAQAAGSPSTALWAEADRQYTDQAPVVSLAVPSEVDFVSDRVGNYQFNLQVGVLIDQLSVR